jgi:hypothetical protein
MCDDCQCSQLVGMMVVSVVDVVIVVISGGGYQSVLWGLHS